MVVWQSAKIRNLDVAAASSGASLSLEIGQFLIAEFTFWTMAALRGCPIQYAADYPLHQQPAANGIKHALFGQMLVSDIRGRRDLSDVAPDLPNLVCQPGRKISFFLG